MLFNLRFCISTKLIMSTPTAIFAIAFLAAFTAAQTPRAKLSPYILLSKYDIPKVISVKTVDNILSKMSELQYMLGNVFGHSYEDFVLDAVPTNEDNSDLPSKVKVEPWLLQKGQPNLLKKLLERKKQLLRDKNSHLKKVKRCHNCEPASEELEESPEIELTCKCSDEDLDPNDTWSMNCVCQEKSNLVYTAYSRYKYLKVNPVTQKKLKYNRNKAFDKIID